MSACRSARRSAWLACGLAVGLAAAGLIGLGQLDRAVSSADPHAPPPALIHHLAEDYAAPLLRLLGTPDPAPAAGAATIRSSLWSLVALGALLAAVAAWSLASRRPATDD